MADRPPAVDLSALSDEIVRLLPEECCRRHTAIPIDRAGHVLVIAIATPANVFALDDIKFMTGFNVEAVAAPAQAIGAALDRHYGTQTQNDSSSDNLEALAAACAADNDEDGLNELSQHTGAAPLVRLTEAIFREAIKMGASDIHIEPVRQGVARSIPNRRPARGTADVSSPPLPAAHFANQGPGQVRSFGEETSSDRHDRPATHRSADPHDRVRPADRKR